MSTETPTPRTDEAEDTQRDYHEQMREIDWPPFMADFDFARALERELIAAREELAALKSWQQQAKDEMEMHGGNEVFACLNDL